MNGSGHVWSKVGSGHFFTLYYFKIMRHRPDDDMSQPSTRLQQADRVGFAASMLCAIHCAAMPLLQPQHFVVPFLAHALGTFAGAFVATRIASGGKRVAALEVTALFFCGGIMAARMIPAPGWFIALDLLCAYFPFAWLGHRLARPRPQ